jgi:hypothetical protein
MSMPPHTFHAAPHVRQAGRQVEDLRDRQTVLLEILDADLLVAVAVDVVIRVALLVHARHQARGHEVRARRRAGLAEDIAPVVGGVGAAVRALRGVLLPLRPARALQGRDLHDLEAALDGALVKAAVSRSGVDSVEMVGEVRIPVRIYMVLEHRLVDLGPAFLGVVLALVDDQVGLVLALDAGTG